MTRLSITGSLTVGPYRGYYGHAEFDAEAGSFHGEVKDTRDVITFVGDDPTSLEAAFNESIEDYLAFCNEHGREPEKPFSGNFMVRATPKLHRELSNYAVRCGVSLNQFVVDALEKQTFAGNTLNKSDTRVEAQYGINTSDTIEVSCGDFEPDSEVKLTVVNQSTLVA